MTVIYADELFLENAVIDYILIILTAKLSGTPVRRVRAVIAAVFGGVYGVAAAGASVLNHFIVKLSIGAGIVLISFGVTSVLLRLCLTFFALSASLAGAVLCAAMMRNGTGITIPLIFTAIAVSAAVFTLAFRNTAKHRVKGELSTVKISRCGRSVTVTALRDTGNALRDPFSGGTVIVCGLDSLEPVLTKKERDILKYCEDPVAAIEKLNLEQCAFRLIPCATVSGDGLLPAFKPDSVFRDGEPVKGAVIAISRSGLHTAEGFAAIASA